MRLPHLARESKASPPFLESKVRKSWYRRDAGDGAGHPVRFTAAFVAPLDLAGAGSVRAKAKAAGRPGDAPADLLKRSITGDLNGVRSRRRREMQCRRNIEAIWLPRSPKPDVKTIAAFRRDKRAAFRPVARAFVSAATSTDARCRPGTEPGSRRSTTRIATSPGPRGKISSARRRDEGDIAEAGTGGARRCRSRMAAVNINPDASGTGLRDKPIGEEEQLNLAGKKLQLNSKRRGNARSRLGIRFHHGPYATCYVACRPSCWFVFP
ncbi:MAG: transposase [Methylocella sp.]